MGYFCSINSAENVTKAVICLTQNLRTSYYKSFNDTNFNESNKNLISLERWLTDKIHSLLKHDNKNHRLNANSSQSQSGRSHVNDKKIKMLVLQLQNFRLYFIKIYSCR